MNKIILLLSVLTLVSCSDFNDRYDFEQERMLWTNSAFPTKEKVDVVGSKPDAHIQGIINETVSCILNKADVLSRQWQNECYAFPSQELVKVYSNTEVLNVFISDEFLISCKSDDQLLPWEAPM